MVNLSSCCSWYFYIWEQACQLQIQKIWKIKNKNMCFTHKVSIICSLNPGLTHITWFSLFCFFLANIPVSFYSVRSKVSLTKLAESVPSTLALLTSNGFLFFAVFLQIFLWVSIRSEAKFLDQFLHWIRPALADSRHRQAAGLITAWCAHSTRSLSLTVQHQHWWFVSCQWSSTTMGNKILKKQ